MRTKPALVAVVAFVIVDLALVWVALRHVAKSAPSQGSEPSGSLRIPE